MANKSMLMLRSLVNTKLDKPSVIFVLGPPGSGKGTQCELLSKNLNLFHLSAGELLRNEVLSASEIGKSIQADMKEGVIVPVSVTIQLLKNAMNERGWERWFLIDGFPRSEENLKGWIEEMDEIARVVCVLYIKCQQKTCVDRIIKRSETSNRIDDNLESVTKRFTTYNYYKSLGKLVKVSGENQQDAVFEQTLEGLQSILTIPSLSIDS